MSYASTVGELREKELEIRAEEYLNAYDPHLPTVVLVPGGMGSRLIRGTVAYQDGVPYTNIEFYELWLNFAAAIQGELRHIAMNQDGQDGEMHPIVASGELSSIVKKYEGVRDFFRGKANFVGLGYDWRRAPDREFMYVRSFLRRIADKVIGRGHEDPRKRLTLFAHSQGGLVAKLFVNDLVDRGERSSDWFQQMVTCCSPFYGTWSHLSRFYVGEALPNLVTGGAAAVSRIVARIKGPYALLPAPKSVLEPRFAALGLARYPVRDAADQSIECDPFAAAMRPRLPDYVVDDHLTDARRQYAQIDAPLPNEVARRVFHIRGSENQAVNRPLEVYWRQGAGPADPISHNGAQGGIHDGTVPFWAARLATTPDSNVFDVTGVQHAGAAENETVLGIVWDLMNGRHVPAGPRPAQPGPAFGDPAPLGQLLIAVQSGARPVDALLDLPPADFRALTQGFNLA